jgi:hypothetical protein
MIILFSSNLNKVEKALVQAETTKLLNVNLMELSKGEYVLLTMILTNKFYFTNSTKCYMCGHYKGKPILGLYH